MASGTVLVSMWAWGGGHEFWPAFTLIPGGALLAWGLVGVAVTVLRAPVANLARLLLMCNDRTEGNKMFMTHEFIAQLLGTYRPNITNAAVNLKGLGFIDYRRGLITIVDKKGLEGESCECYKILQKCFKKYLSSLHRTTIKTQVDCVNSVPV